MEPMHESPFVPHPLFGSDTDPIAAFDRQQFENRLRTAGNIGPLAVVSIEQDILAAANQGVALKASGDLAGAERRFRLAAVRGHIGHMSNLAGVLAELGSADEAMAWYERAATVGRAITESATRTYGEWPSEAGDGGISDCFLRFGQALYNRGQTVQSKAWFGRSMRLGDARAAYALAQIAAIEGDPAYEQYLQEAAILAHANLSQHASALRKKYGPAGIARRTDILEAYATFLQSSDQPVWETWRNLAQSYTSTPIE